MWHNILGYVVIHENINVTLAYWKVTHFYLVPEFLLLIHFDGIQPVSVNQPRRYSEKLQIL